jgi:hypothetical protein
LIAPLIAADDSALELLGAELTPEARARFNEERSARIASRSQINAHPLQIVEGCLRMALDPRMLGLGIAFCPVMPVIWVAGAGTVKGVKHIKASLQEPSLKIPEKDADRIAAVLNEGATGAALAKRAARFTQLREFAKPEDSEARLVVRIKSARIANVRSWPGLVLTAEAQVIRSDGVALEPTEYVCTYGPLAAWTVENAELSRALDESLDALAESIASIYLRTWKLTESAAEKPAAMQAGTDAGTARLSADPSFVLLPPGTGFSIPAVGDTWSYRVTYRQRGGPKSSTHRVTIARLTRDAIVEQLATEQSGSTQTEHTKGGHLVRQGEVSLFSPYFLAFDSPVPGTRIPKIENLDPQFCDVKWICSATARVVGQERVHVPAGEFQTIKVEVEHAWTGRFQNVESGWRTLTVWYSPQTKRAVKFSSRGNRSAHIESEFDLELEEYRLN